MKNKEQTINRLGYKMTMAQADLLFEMLADDIFNRYNNEEYWDPKIIEDFVIDNKLKEAK